PEFVRELVERGAGPRARQKHLEGARAMPAHHGRSCESKQDVNDVAVPVLRHRVATNFKARAEGIDTVDLVGKLVDAIPRAAEARYA
ncbi:MAG: AAA family ATPase, partial [Planctomycetes bacterium]|nr:AAA family ATPase [Planctomycetota bacterium]